MLGNFSSEVLQLHVVENCVNLKSDVHENAKFAMCAIFILPVENVIWICLSKPTNKEQKVKTWAQMCVTTKKIFKKAQAKT